MVRDVADRIVAMLVEGLASPEERREALRLASEVVEVDDGGMTLAEVIASLPHPPRDLTPFDPRPGRPRMCLDLASDVTDR